MKKVYHIALKLSDQNKKFCLATLVATSGSVPQVPGSSALFSEEGLLAGTLGGGVMEGDAMKKAFESLNSLEYQLYDVHLDASIKEEEEAICGGNATILVDPDPSVHMSCFRDMSGSLEKGKNGIMITLIRKNAEKPISRYWLEHHGPETINLRKYLQDNLPGELLKTWPEIEKPCPTSLSQGNCISQTSTFGDFLFIEPVFPLPRLYIAGAGHVGKALSHLAALLDFEVTVIDDRAEYANAENLPDADHIIVRSIGEAMTEIPVRNDSYVVIVSRGHKDDAEALKAIIKKEMAYTGMIGSRKKIRLMKAKFIEEGWATKEEFDRVHAPIGIEIGSVSVQEIALSIAAQLVQVRASSRSGKKREIISSVILAAGESRRMGEPKMLMPFGDSTILATVITNAMNSAIDHVHVVLGAGAEGVGKSIDGQNVVQVINSDFRSGMLSSVQAGLRSLPNATTAVMILLGDQPMISSSIMDRLAERYKRSEKTIFIASANGKKGHPVIFAAKYIPEILSYGPDDSLRKLYKNHPNEVEEMETANPEILRDIDTRGDYENEILILAQIDVSNGRTGKHK